MDFISNCQQHDPDLIGFCEHNLHPDPQVTSQFTEAIHRISKNTKSVLSATPIPSATPFKPGGTGYITFQSTTGRVYKSYSDAFGRWTAVTLKGKNVFITVIVTYQSPVATGNNNCMTYHQQQLTCFQQLSNSQNKYANFTDKSPRQFFRRDLLKFVQQFYDQDHKLIIVGDFNDTPDESSVTFQLCQKYQLHDPWETSCDDCHSNIPTYHRGKRRIDRILLSDAIKSECCGIQYTDYHMIAQSDHRGIILDLNLSIFKEPPIPIHQPTPRSI